MRRFAPPARDRCPIIAISCPIVRICPHDLHAASTRAPAGS